MTTNYDGDFDTTKGVMIEYLHNGKKKRINLLDVDRKYYPPRDPDPNVHVAATPAYMTFLINYVSNKLTAEFNAEYEAKKREEELKEMQEREKKQRELAERRRQAQRTSTPKSRLKSFFDGDTNRCHFCYSPPYTLTCSKICQAPMRIDMSSTISDIRALIKEYEQQKQEIATLKQQLEQATTTTAQR
jgi:hypothetical protein